MKKQNSISMGLSLILMAILSINVICCIGILITESIQDKVLFGFILSSMSVSFMIIYLIGKNNLSAK